MGSARDPGRLLVRRLPRHHKGTDVLDALPDSVVEHHPGGLKALQNLRRSWIKTNQDMADAYAKRIGLMK